MILFFPLTRVSNIYVLRAYDLLMVHLCKEHAEVRWSTFMIINELFQRSHCFREKLVSELQPFFTLAVGIDPEEPLPPPKVVAKRLRFEALKAIQQWNEKFGNTYKKLALGYNFLKNCKMVDFNDIHARTIVERQREAEAERKKQVLLQRKKEKILKEIEETFPHLESCLTQSENCYQLLIQTDEFFKDDDDDNNNNVDDHNKNTEKRKTDIRSKEKDSDTDISLSCNSSPNTIASDHDTNCDDSNHSSSQKTDGNTASSSLSETGKGSNETSENKSEKDNNEKENDDKDEDVSGNDGNEGDDNVDNDCGGGDSSEKEEREEENKDDDDDGDEKDDEGASSSDLIRSHGLGSMNYCLTIDVPNKMLIKETEDNKDILITLRDMHNLISHQYLPNVKRWLKELSKTGPDNETVKKLTDAMTKLNKAKSQLDELNLEGVKSMTDDETDDDDFEEVEEKEGYESDIPEHLKNVSAPGHSRQKIQSKAFNKTLVKKYISSPMLRKQPSFGETSKQWDIKATLRPGDEQDPASMAATMNKWKKELLQKNKDQIMLQDEQNRPSTSSDTGSSVSIMPSQSNAEKELNERKERLLQQAPFIPFGPDLAFWENPDKIEVPSVVKDDSLHRFWVPQQAETSSSQQEIALIKNRSFTFTGTFEPVKWQCRAPMPNGTLCKRMDRIKVRNYSIPHFISLHTNISHFVHLNKTYNSAGAEKNHWQDKELQKDIEAALGIDLGSNRDLCVEGNKKKKRKGKGKAKKKSELTDLTLPKNTSENRLKKKLFNVKTMKRVNATLDMMDAKKARDKFGNQFNYAHL
ncbi:UV-stimulated scaffold protein A [Octopus bimaculoides]|uniref:UV-stimulated scaffold protein A n=1 Tax=Octopus bimaculoides TaxID=37653 RepID=UPI0022E2153E|nr:UV-stimulated scaffold protein A [Octopus bimaculoides]